jgi:hypothetical protein
MIFEDVLRDLLVGFTLVDTRVFLMRAPQVPAPKAVTPYLVFLHVGPEPMHAQSGPLDVLRREYQFSFFDLSQSRALALSDALRQRLDGLRGTFEGVNFGGVFYRAQTSSYEDDTRLFQSITTYLFQYRIPGTLPALSQRQQLRLQLRKENA